MTDRIKRLRELILSGKQKQYREKVEYRRAEEFEKEKTPDVVRVSERLKEVLLKQKPVILPDQRILFLRTTENLPEIYTEGEWNKVKENHFIHELGRVCNICPGYETVIKEGLEAEKVRCSERLSREEKESSRLFYQSVIDSIDAVYELTSRYEQLALSMGKKEEAERLRRVVREGAASFHDALQSFRILHFTLWCEGEYHNTVGRFDQYMWPYFKQDLEQGVLSEAEAFELLEEFFLTFNLDSDLYPGIQQGDNGQSMMLGGCDKEGRQSFHLLSELCLKASGELGLIDPKINLRVNQNTPLSVFETGTELTRAGLGFPQYSNDDIVIEGLVKKGYALEDARDYTVAACWEFIIPRLGMDIPNIGAVNFPALLNETLMDHLEESSSYEMFYQFYLKRIKRECKEMNEKIHSLVMIPAPFLSIMMEGCVESGRDISEGGKYNNYGFHGVGISTAVDSLAVVQKTIYEEKSLSKQEALEIINGNEKGEWPARLRYEEPKFGNQDPLTDAIAVSLLHEFGEALKPLVNERGGVIRAGTGSAMFYLWHARQIGTMLSGHRKGEAFSANYAPELFVRNNGPLSAVMSLTAPDLTECINGGPMTMEFHSSVFRDQEGLTAVAELVREFIRHGGHQLQLNSVNKEVMLEAQRQPENYRNLIVRIWGWSAYFVELDREYQDHVIARQEFLIV